MSIEQSVKLASELELLAKQITSLAERVRREGLPEIPPHILKIVDKRRADNECLECGLTLVGEKFVKRGCHESCYQSTLRMIERMEITEEQLIATGRWRLPEKGGPKKKKPSLHEPASNPQSAAEAAIEKTKKLAKDAANSAKAAKK